jgi:hypothetical protein
MNKQLQKESFNEQFEKLAALVSKYGQFPGKSDSPELYRWMLYIRTRYRYGLLDDENIRLLNTLGFIWNSREWRWFNKAAELKRLLMEYKIIPSVKEHKKLYYWLLDSCDRLRNNVLPGNKRAVIEEINRLLNDILPLGKTGTIKTVVEEINRLLNDVQPLETTVNKKAAVEENNRLLKGVRQLKKTGNKKSAVKMRKRLSNGTKPLKESALLLRQRAVELRWTSKFNDLVEFRKTQTDQWPSLSAIDEKEQELAKWCQRLRAMFKKKSLEERWIHKLEGITFNFKKSQFDRWKETFLELDEYLQLHQKIPGPKTPLRSWVVTQYRDYFDLSPEKQELLAGINFLQCFMYKSQEHQLAS